MVVGAGEGHRLADGHFVQHVLAHALELGGVVEGTGPDDAALALHQPGNRMLGTDAAGVGEGNGGAGEVVGGQLVGARFDDDLFIGGQKLAEAHGVGAFDSGHEECAGAVRFWNVDGEPQRHMGRGDNGGTAVDLGVINVLAGEVLQRLHQRPADQVGERHLAAAGSLQVIVDHDPVVDHQLGGHGAHAGGGRHRQTRGHVRGEGLGHSSQWGGDVDRTLGGCLSRRVGELGRLGRDRL